MHTCICWMFSHVRHVHIVIVALFSFNCFVILYIALIFVLFSFFIPNKFEHKNSHCHKHSEFTHVKLSSNKSRSYGVNVFDMICLVLALKLTKCSFCWYIFHLDLLQRWRRSYSNNNNGIFISQLHGIKVNWHLWWTHPFDVGCKSVGTTILRMRSHEAITLLPINCVSLSLSLINVRKKTPLVNCNQNHREHSIHGVTSIQTNKNTCTNNFFTNSIWAPA